MAGISSAALHVWVVGWCRRQHTCMPRERRSRVQGGGGAGDLIVILLSACSKEKTPSGCSALKILPISRQACKQPCHISARTICASYTRARGKG